MRCRNGVVGFPPEWSKDTYKCLVGDPMRSYQRESSFYPIIYMVQGPKCSNYHRSRCNAWLGVVGPGGPVLGPAVLFGSLGPPLDLHRRLKESFFDLQKKHLIFNRFLMAF